MSASAQRNIGLILLVASITVNGGADARKGSGGRGGFLRILPDTRLEVRPRYMRPCNTPHNVLTDLNVTMGMLGRTSIAINMEGTIRRTAEQMRKCTGAIDKCADLISESTCSSVDKYETADACNLMMGKMMPWNKIVSQMKPPLLCPPRAGRYVLKNATVEMQIFNTFSKTMRLEGYIWRFTGSCFDGKGENFLCVDAASEFFRVRKKHDDNAP